MPIKFFNLFSTQTYYATSLAQNYFVSAEYSAKMDCTAYSGSSVSGSPNKFLVDDG